MTQHLRVVTVNDGRSRARLQSAIHTAALDKACTPEQARAIAADVALALHHEGLRLVHLGPKGDR